MPNVYTRGGDKGETGLLGGSRTPKDDIRVEAYGTMDEANAAIGNAYALSSDNKMREILHHIQQRIFVLGAELASDAKGKEMLKDAISTKDIEFMEAKLDEYLAIIGPQKEFVIPGKNPVSSALHVARTIVRRGERRIITYAGQSDVRPELIKFANRLSDLLFVFARTEEYNETVKQVVMKVKEELGISDLLQNKESSLLTLSKRLAAAARVKANEMNLPIVFSVVDTGGNLVYFERMEGALLVSIDVSVNKAYTANALNLRTDVLGSLSKEDGPLYSIENAVGGRIVLFGGGFPLMVGDKKLGAIGISGGTPEQDMAIGESALNIL